MCRHDHTEYLVGKIYKLSIYVLLCRPSHSKCSLYVLQCTLLTCSKDMLLRSLWEGNGIQKHHDYWLCTCHLASLFDLATLKKHVKIHKSYEATALSMMARIQYISCKLSSPFNRALPPLQHAIYTFHHT
jgi:hypothetical protein